MQTNMRREIDEIPEAAARLLERSANGAGASRRGAAAQGSGLSGNDRQRLFRPCRAVPEIPIELTIGRPVASLGPSLASIYGADLKLGGAAAIATRRPARARTSWPWPKPRTRRRRFDRADNTLPSPIAEACTTARHSCRARNCVAADPKSYVNSIVAGLARARDGPATRRSSMRSPICRTSLPRP